MFKVLLVDDERVILDGISRFVNWQALGTELAGTARNGLEALEFITNHQPDIVITDILMPGMDGLELVAKVRAMELPVQFIMLSGFSDFEYARQAIRYGVKEYLLKPCNEETIARAITEVIQDLEQLQHKERFMERLQAEFRQALPHAREQLFKEFVTNKTYGKRDWERYRGLLGIRSDDAKVRLILFELEDSHEYEHLFALKNIALDILGHEQLLLSTTIGPQVILLVEDEEAQISDHLYSRIDQIKRIFYEYYKIDTSIALSEGGLISEARRMFREAQSLISHRFYLEESIMITKHDVVNFEESRTNSEDIDVQIDEERLGMLIKAGRTDEVQAMIGDYFERLANWRMDANMTKTYAITLYLSIIRHDPERTKHLMAEIASLDSIHTLTGLQSFVEKAALEIASRNYESTRHKHSSIIRKVLEIIQNNLGNPELSLNSVAQEMLYMNADYLGKLFKKETGEKFSNYVTRLRMEKAIEMITSSDDAKIFEIAESLGYGDNPQYFSKVFKKYTGFTPSEFKSS
jgi:two-component system response regulator YesN